MPEDNWWIPLIFSYIGAMKIFQSVIYGSDYQNTCNYESIHMRIRIFDHFSRFRFSTLSLATFSRREELGRLPTFKKDQHVQ